MKKIIISILVILIISFSIYYAIVLYPYARGVAKDVERMQIQLKEELIQNRWWHEKGYSIGDTVSFNKLNGGYYFSNDTVYACYTNNECIHAVGVIKYLTYNHFLIQSISTQAEGSYYVEGTLELPSIAPSE